MYLFDFDFHSRALIKRRFSPIQQREVTPVMRIAIEALGQLARSGQLNQMGQCTIFQSVRHLLMHLSLPNEGGPHPPPMMMPGGAPGPPPPGYMGMRPAAPPGGMIPIQGHIPQGPGVGGQQFMN